MIRIILADDHQSFIDGIESNIINHQDNIKVVKTINHGQAVLEVLEKEKVDVAVLDISMKGMQYDNWITAREIKEKHPTVEVLILTMHLNGKFIKELMDIGIRGYVVKNRSAREVVKAIQLIHAGKTHFSEGVSDAYITEQARQEELDKIHLTPREREILEILAVENLTAKEIAAKLFIEKSTVDTHKQNLMRKIGVNSDKALVKFALENFDQ